MKVWVALRRAERFCGSLRLSWGEGRGGEDDGWGGGVPFTVKEMVIVWREEGGRGGGGGKARLMV